MRILLTSISLDPICGGGTTERTRKLAKYLKLAGHDVTVAAIEDGPVATELNRLGVQTYSTGFVKLRYVVPLISPLRLWRLVSTSDVIHILGYWNLLSVATAMLARALGKPYVFCAAGEFAALERRPPIARLFHATVGTPMVAGAKVLIAITEQERAEIIQRFGRAPHEVVVIENGVEAIVVDDTVEDEGLPDGRFVLFLGRLAPVKGPDILIDAFARIAGEFKDTVLVMAGPDFGLEANLRRSVRDASLGDRVLFSGFLNEQQRTRTLRRAAFLVVPSRSEAMSLVAVEAGMQGTPVLVTETCGLGVVAEIGGGLVCAPTVEGVAQGLRAMLAAPDLVAQGERWREHVSGNFQWPELVSRLVTLFRRYT